MKRSLLLIPVLLAGLCAAPSYGQDGTAALGADGEVYLPKVGAYRDLFPKDHATAPGNTVLAVDLIQPGAPPQRLLVPFTTGSDVESTPAVLYEDDSDTLFLLWANQVNSISSVLMLASFDGAHWGAPIQITGNPFSSKMSPQLAITRDSFQLTDSSGNPATHHRTIVHVAWEEQTAAGTTDVLYTPVIFEEGNYLGWAPVYNLNDMVGRTPSGSSFAPPDVLVQTPVLQAGRDARTLVVSFASAETRALAAVEIDVLPEEISLLAASARANIIDLGRSLYPNYLQVLADKAYENVIAQGTAFHDDVIGLIAGKVRDQILANRGTESSDLTSLSENARANIIDLGSRLSGRGLRDRGSNAKSLIESTVSVDPATSDSTAPSHLIHFRVAANRPAPQVGSAGIQLFLSESGDDAIVAWSDTGKLLYRLSQDSGWSDPRQITLTSSLDAPHAYTLLKQRARSR
ncbi:MAG TPA: hypothetical protein VF173_34075 [Thermoanaerobaculia bacterium]|nr:hypothetical protein [Thermoanaerobaculia bacterium]